MADENILGTPNNDTLDAGAGADTVQGLSGNDSIDGGDGNDVIFGDAPKGLYLNQGVTDQYAEVAGFTGMPTNAMTVEMTVTGEVGNHFLMSYAVEENTAGNEFLLEARSTTLFSMLMKQTTTQVLTPRRF